MSEHKKRYLIDECLNVLIKVGSVGAVFGISEALIAKYVYDDLPLYKDGLYALTAGALVLFQAGSEK